jgi:adenylate cyclase
LAAAAVTTLIGVGVGTLVTSSGALSAIQLRWEDSLQPGLDDRTDVVVVAIDRHSISVFGDGWPWPRERDAALIDAINAGGPAAIAVDMVFTDEREGDDVLEQSLAAAPVIISSALTLEVDGVGVPTISDQVLPTEQLTKAADAVGHTNVVASEGGVVRRIALVAATSRGVLRPSLSLAAVAIADGVDPVITEQSGGVQVGNRFVPLEAGMLELNFSPALDKRDAIPAADVLADGFDPSVFAGKIVVLGVTEPTLGDLHPVPPDRSGNTPGVFVIANAINTIRTSGYLLEPDSTSQLLLTLITVLLVALAISRLRLSVAAVVVVGALAGVGLFAGWKFSTTGEQWDVVGPTAGILAATAAGAAWRYTTEVRHRRRAWHLFASYVSPSVVSQLEDGPTLQRAVAGTRVPVTLLFCDLRGFTPMASTLDPSDVRAVLEHYYASTVAEIHRLGGTVVQFVGDEVFAAWGAPVADDLQAPRAVECALNLQKLNPKLNETLAAAGLPPVTYGIGVHCGPVVSAHVGTHERRQYAVVGNTVNVGSRLCSQALTGEVVASDDVAQLLPEELRAQLGEIERVSVKGVAEPLPVRRAKPLAPVG